MEERTYDLNEHGHLPQRLMEDKDPPEEQAYSEAPRFEIDAMTIQLIVARVEGGRKVQEYNIQPQRLLYPFDVRALEEAALAVARKQWEEAGR